VLHHFHGRSHGRLDHSSEQFAQVGQHNQNEWNAEERVNYAEYFAVRGFGANVTVTFWWRIV
jgi:nucleoside-specific outer membrane channel protein Tsx